MDMWKVFIMGKAVKCMKIKSKVQNQCSSLYFPKSISGPDWSLARITVWLPGLMFDTPGLDGEADE